MFAVCRHSHKLCGSRPVPGNRIPAGDRLPLERRFPPAADILLLPPTAAAQNRCVPEAAAIWGSVTVAHLGYHYRVIARAFRPAAISWYNLQKCCAMGKVVPGDCHVAALLAMTVVGATWCHSYHIASKQQFTAPTKRSE